MSTIKQQSEAFIRLMNQHAAEMNTLSRAFDQAVEAMASDKLASSLVEEKVAA